MFEEFIHAYGTTIIYTIITALLGFFGMLFKNLIQKYMNDKTKQAVAVTCVKAVDQIYKDMHGDEKLDRCIGYMTEMLAEKGITVSELEIRMLIEAAVKELNLYITAPLEADLPEDEYDAPPEDDTEPAAPEDEETPKTDAE